MALNNFLGELKDLQIALAVRQLQPTTVAEAMQATIELKSFLAVTNLSSVPDAVQSVTELRLESSTIMNEWITNVNDKLVSQIDVLELLLDRNKLVECTAEIHCECQR